MGPRRIELRSPPSQGGVLTTGLWARKYNLIYNIYYKNLTFNKNKKKNYFFFSQAKTLILAVFP